MRRNNNIRLAVVRLVEQGKKTDQISNSANAPNFAVSFISLVTGLISQMLASPQNIDTHRALKDLKVHNAGLNLGPVLKRRAIIDQ